MPNPIVEAPELTAVLREIALVEGQGERLTAAVEQLARLDGVLHVELRGDARLRLRYDVARIAHGEIERVLDGAGLCRRATLWWRVRAAWYRYLDENIKANAGARGGACCSRPPPGGGPEAGS